MGILDIFVQLDQLVHYVICYELITTLMLCKVLIAFIQVTLGSACQTVI